MTVERTDVIDLVTESKDGAVNLIVTEDRPWDGSGQRLLELQAKLNTYLAFALEGAMEEQFPSTRGKPIRIQLDYVFAPDQSAQEFLARAANTCEDHGIELWTNQL